MKAILYLLCSFSCVCALYAQPGGLLSPASHFHLLDNPAGAGLDGKHHVFFGGGKKWFNVDQAPTSAFISTSHPFFNRGLGIGGTIVNDQRGLISNTRVALNLAVHLNPENQHRFSFGAAGQFQFLGFDAPKSFDILPENGISASKINLGLGANYQVDLDKDNSFFNLYFYLPQFKSSVDLREDNLAYQLTEGFIIQGNLQYELSEKILLTPAFRYLSAPLGGFQSRKQVFDISLGASFGGDKIQVRLGANTGEASAIYGGIGFRFGKVNLHVFAEPGSPLGTSGYFDGEIIFGIPDSIQHSNPVKKSKKVRNKRFRRKKCWENENCLESRLVERGIQEGISSEVVPVPNSKETFFSFTFSDRIDAYIDYFEHDNFLNTVPLRDLFVEIGKLTKEIGENKKSRVLKINLIVEVKNPLDQLTFETYEGKSFKLLYTVNDEKTKYLKPGIDLTQEELAALKLHLLGKRLNNAIIGLRNLPFDIKVEYNPDLEESRKVSIGFTVN